MLWTGYGRINLFLGLVVCFERTLTAAPETGCESWYFWTGSRNWKCITEQNAKTEEVKMSSKLKATEIKAKLTSNPCLWLAGQLWWCTATEEPVRTQQWDGYANVSDPYRVLGARLDGAHVGDLGVADDRLRDHTLNTEVHNLDRDEVVVGDVDEILWDGKKNSLSGGTVSADGCWGTFRVQACLMWLGH